MEKKLEKNKLLKKAFLLMYPSSLLLAFISQIEEFLDALLAGGRLGDDAIAAVSIGWPGIAVILAVCAIFSLGVSLLLSINIGRGNKEESNRLYSIGMVTITTIVAIIGIIIFFVPGPMVKLFSGGATGDILTLAEIYARSYGFVIPLFFIEVILSQVLAIYGYNKEVAIINVLGIPVNVVFSILGLKWFGAINEMYAIAGLVFGYFVSTLFEDLGLLFIKFRKQIKLKIVTFTVKLKELLEIIKYGFSGGINFAIDAAICAIINLLLVRYIGEEALGFYTIVESIILLARAAAEAGGNAGAPLFGLLFGARDKNGTISAVKKSISVSLICTILWCLLIYAFLPVIIPFFSEEINPYTYNVVSRGVTICLLLIPGYLIIKCLASYYQAIGNFKRTLILTVIPDSIIFPWLMFILLAGFNLGYDAVWISYGGCYLIFLALIYLYYILNKGKLKWPIDKMLLIDNSFKEDVVFDFSTTSETNQKNSIISEKVIEFLKQEKYSDRIANMCGLCLEELNADFMEHIKNSKKDVNIEKEVMDIKLISDKGNLTLIIRNIARPYNPLDFTFNKNDFSKLGIVMIQKFAKKIEYSYVYKMNVITIEI